MVQLQPLYAKSDILARSQHVQTDYFITITGAKTAALTDTILNPGCMIFDFDAAGNLTQAKVDAYLANSGEAAGGIVCTTCFDATSLGANMLGFVIDTGGQALRAGFMEITVVTTAGGTPAANMTVTKVATAALTSSASQAFAISPGGNIYGRLTDANLDAGTAGFVKITIHWDPK